MTTPSLPIIDLAALKGTPATRSQMLAQLGQAAREVGFFYLVGHDLSESARQETLALAAHFFALPLEEKLAVQMVHSPPLSRLQPGGGRAHPGTAGSAGAVRYHERGPGPACGAHS